jgi:2-isopropylmalate synthase
MQPTKVTLYDTTLRDGTQGEGIALSADDKLRIARRLDEFGMAYIEGGWPGSNPKDIEFFERAQNELNLKRARLAPLLARPARRASNRRTTNRCNC